MSDTASLTTNAVANSLSPIDLFLHADGIVRSVIILLLLAAAWGWTIIIDKLVRISLLNRRATRLIASIGSGLPVNHVAESFVEASERDPLVRVYHTMVEENERSADLTQTEAQTDGLQERVHRVAQLASSNALENLQKGLPFLATIGAVAPFVGLFGTVWGIMSSFQGIASSNNTSLSVVAPGIAEALFATALGLAAAIPAVVFYNRISTDIGAYAKRLNGFIGVFEVELSRQLARKGERNGLRAA